MDFTEPSLACPVVADFDPLDQGFLDDPYAGLDRVRDHGPVLFSPVLDRWVVTGYAEIEQILLDPSNYSAAEVLRPLYPLCEQATEIIGGLARAATMPDADPPQHVRYRSVMMRAISPRRMAQLAPIIRERCDKLIDTVRSQCRAEVVATLCHPLPAATMFALIGFPAGDGEQIKSWCEANLEVVWGRPSPDRQVRSARGIVAFLDHCRKLVRARRADPADDLVSDLIADERNLTDEEASSMVFALSLAGHETTTNLLGNALVQLLSRPAVWDEVRADRSLVTGAVEETLRFDTSVPMWRRATTRETVLGGVALPAGARLLLAFGASNREADHFPDPHRFDVRRVEARRQLSFGKGIHLCPGAALARLECEIVLNALADRLPGLRLVKDQRVSYPPLISFRGPRTLYLEWD